MEKSTYKEFKKETFEGESINWMRDWYIKHHKKALFFIEQLLKQGVKLSSININDWNCNYEPSVYVGSGRYRRLAKNDWKLALKRLQ